MRLIQLYGYRNPNHFTTQFNKKMSGGVKQYMPPPTVNISSKRRIAYKTGGSKPWHLEGMVPVRKI